MSKQTVTVLLKCGTLISFHILNHKNFSRLRSEMNVKLKKVRHKIFKQTCDSSRTAIGEEKKNNIYDVHVEFTGKILYSIYLLLISLE